MKEEKRREQTKGTAFDRAPFALCKHGLVTIRQGLAVRSETRRGSGEVERAPGTW